MAVRHCRLRLLGCRRILILAADMTGYAGNDDRDSRFVAVKGKIPARQPLETSS